MKKLPVAELVVGLLVLAVGLGVYVLSHRDQADIEATKARGDLIVSALERYRSSAGAYPSALENLVPAQLDSLPAPTWGDAWRYSTFGDGAHAELYVRSRDSPLILRYDFTANGWALDN